MTMPRTSDFFHGYAQDFDAIYGNQHGALNAVVNNVFRKSMRLRYEKTLGGCDPIEGRSVLDVGCGPGHYAIDLAARGVGSVWGIDFADGMLDIARQGAGRAGVADRCRFTRGDFLEMPIDEAFDYVVVMGFMDYMPDPKRVVDKVVSLTKSRAFFSFPVAGGLLGWQRQLRYKRRCDLFLYTEPQLREIVAGLPRGRAEIERIARDYFVTIHID